MEMISPFSEEDDTGQKFQLGTGESPSKHQNLILISHLVNFFQTDIKPAFLFSNFLIVSKQSFVSFL